MTRPIWIDTDTASDDAVALMMAMSANNCEIIGISVVAGNVPLEKGIQNALYVKDLCGADVPVFAGADSPLVRPLKTAQHVHGEDGMGDIGLELTGRKPDDGHAVDALIEAIYTFDGELEIITLGPLTNIALALKMDPGISAKIKRCYIMGGTSDYYGNLTPVSEFNIWADPEAADVVFSKNFPKTMVGWDISRKFASISAREADAIKALGTEKAIVAIDSQKTVRDWCREVTKVDGFDLPDPIAMAVAIEPSMITASRDAAVTVVLADGPTSGMTMLDDRDYTDRPRCIQVVTQVCRDSFMNQLAGALKC